MARHNTCKALRQLLAIDLAWPHCYVRIVVALLIGVSLCNCAQVQQGPSKPAIGFVTVNGPLKLERENSRAVAEARCLLMEGAEKFDLRIFCVYRLPTVSFARDRADGYITRGMPLPESENDFKKWLTPEVFSDSELSVVIPFLFFQKQDSGKTVFQHVHPISERTRINRIDDEVTYEMPENRVILIKDMNNIEEKEIVIFKVAVHDAIKDRIAQKYKQASEHLNKSLGLTSQEIEDWPPMILIGWVLKISKWITMRLPFGSLSGDLALLLIVIVVAWLFRCSRRIITKSYANKTKTQVSEPTIALLKQALKGHDAKPPSLERDIKTLLGKYSALQQEYHLRQPYPDSKDGKGSEGVSARRESATTGIGQGITPLRRWWSYAVSLLERMPAGTQQNSAGSSESQKRVEPNLEPNEQDGVIQQSNIRNAMPEGMNIRTEFSRDLQQMLKDIDLPQMFTKWLEQRTLDRPADLLQAFLTRLPGLEEFPNEMSESSQQMIHNVIQTLTEKSARMDRLCDTLATPQHPQPNGDEAESFYTELVSLLRLHWNALPLAETKNHLKVTLEGVQELWKSYDRQSNSPPGVPSVLIASLIEAQCAQQGQIERALNSSETMGDFPSMISQLIESHKSAQRIADTVPGLETQARALIRLSQAALDYLEFPPPEAWDKIDDISGLTARLQPAEPQVRWLYLALTAARGTWKAYADTLKEKRLDVFTALECNEAFIQDWEDTLRRLRGCNSVESLWEVGIDPGFRGNTFWHKLCRAESLLRTYFPGENACSALSDHLGQAAAAVRCTLRHLGATLTYVPLLEPPPHGVQTSKNLSDALRYVPEVSGRVKDLLNQPDDPGRFVVEVKGMIISKDGNPSEAKVVLSNHDDWQSTGRGHFA